MSQMTVDTSQYIFVFAIIMVEHHGQDRSCIDDDDDDDDDEAIE